jgi:predicted ATPase
MNTLALTTITYIHSRDYAAANAGLDELIVLANDKSSVYWKAFGTWLQGWLFSLTGKAANAVPLLTSGIATWQSTGATLLAPMQSSCLAAAYAQLGQFADARRSIDEAMTAINKSRETWYEAEVNRIAGEIALRSPEPDTAKAQEYFEHALSVARQQQAKSWELRAAMSVARLWRDQGKVQQARELLAPVYGWFTEGFDTRDLKEAKALLEELAV